MEISTTNDKVISLLYGRLGNILFEIGAGLSYAKKYGKELHFVNKDKKVTPFHEYPKFCEAFSTDEIVHLNNEPYSVILENQKVRPEPLAYVGGHLFLDGYFQSEIYLDVDYIREKFSIDEELRNTLVEKYKGIEDGVGMSIRRGDYLKYPGIFNVMSKEYYERMYDAHFRGLTVYISSDDIEWCRNNIEIEKCVYVDESDEDTLRALSLCRHHILSCSTFGWWSAWLEEKADSINIVPNPWFKKESGLYYDSVCPERWKRVDIKENYIYRTS